MFPVDRRSMASVTIQVLDGVDKGRVFRNLGTPVTIGREEGNIVRLNDERVSRFHAKVQQDQDDLILTDLESTNGTKVNGNVVQIRRLRLGDCITVGRSVLLVGSNEEIAAKMATLAANVSKGSAGNLAAGPATIEAPADREAFAEADYDFDLNLDATAHVPAEGLYVGNRALPPLPMHLSPSQAARLAEILDFLHLALAKTTEKMQGNEAGTQVSLDFSTWQRVIAVQMLLARYVRAVGEPENSEE